MGAMTHALGRHVEHDERSRNFAFQVTKPLPEVDTFWADHAPVLDQGDVGGCVGWTGADLLNTDAFTPVRRQMNGGAYFANADGLKFYEDATRYDNIPGQYQPGNPNSVDTGSSGVGLGKALKNLGLITRYTHAFSWHAFVQAILTQPVALGTLWTKGMFTPDRNGQVHVGPLTQSNIEGGHEYMARGYSVSRGLVLCRNHWDKSWNPKVNGQKLPGEFWISVPDLQELLENKGDVTVLHGVGML